MQNKMQKAEGIIELITKLGSIAEEQFEEATDAETRAFLFGNLNLAATLIDALTSEEDITRVTFNLKYESALRAYRTAKQEYNKEYADEEQSCEKNKDLAKELKKALKEHQITMEELFPAIFEALNKVSKKKPSSKKPNKE